METSRTRETDTGQRLRRRWWSAESVADWFETEGSVFTTLGGKGRPTRLRVVVTSQGEDGVVKSIYEYLKTKGFNPSFRPSRTVMKKGRPRKRSSECELLRTAEQDCFLRQILPLLRTERRKSNVIAAINWLQARQKVSLSNFKSFEYVEL